VPYIKEIQIPAVFYILISILILVTGFFLAPLGILLYVQLRNFILGRTTMERFSRSAGDADQNTKIMNSGIRNDIMVYRSTITSRFGNSQVSGRESANLGFDEHQ
jgi:hypothetical protein